jgi:hypothetical protein
MFGRMKLAHARPARHAPPHVETVGHILAFALGIPIACAVIGSMVQGFPTALLGFAIGLAVCAVTGLVLTAAASD